MKSRVLLSVALAFLGTAAAALNNGQAPEAVDETFYKSFFTTQDRDERIRVFNGLPAERKAALMNTHARRWLAVNVDTLTGEQIMVIGEALTLLTPGLYREKDAQVAEKLEVVSARVEMVLGQPRAAQAFRIQGPYIPRVK